MRSINDDIAYKEKRDVERKHKLRPKKKYKVNE